MPALTSVRGNTLGTLAACRHRFDMYVASSSQAPTEAHSHELQSVLLFTASSDCLRLLSSISSPPPSPLSRCVIRPETITCNSLGSTFTREKLFTHQGGETALILTPGAVVKDEMK